MLRMYLLLDFVGLDLYYCGEMKRTDDDVEEERGGGGCMMRGMTLSWVYDGCLCIRCWVYIDCWYDCIYKELYMSR